MAGRVCSGVATLAIAGQLSGCSLIFVNKAPSHVPVGTWADCTESLVFPAIDAVYGTASVIGAFGIGMTADDSNSEEAAQVVAPIYGLIGVAILYSAYVGFRETSRCSKIRSDAEARGVYGPQYYPPQPYYPQPYPPQPYPPQPPYPPRRR